MRERKPSGCPFASNNPPQRQNCKIMLQNLILQFWKQLGRKVRRNFWAKLLHGAAVQDFLFYYTSNMRSP